MASMPSDLDVIYVPPAEPEPEVSTNEPATVESTSKMSPPVRRPAKRNTENDELASEVLHSVHEYFKRPSPNKDRFDEFGSAVAAKLRDLTKRQRILAEKIINEILFEAEIENLTITHRFINAANLNVPGYNTPSPVVHSTSSPMQHNPYYTVHPPNFIVSYPTHLSQPIPQVALQPHQLQIHPQANFSAEDPGIVEISIPESAAQYWSNFSYENM